MRMPLNRRTLVLLLFVLIGTVDRANAQTPYIGEIRWVGFNFAPAGWAKCDGQLVSIAQYDALFALIGTTYGGDGQTTFALPDMRGRIAIHQGTGLGLNPRIIGEQAGQEAVTLSTSQIASHAHQLKGTTNVATALAPSGNAHAAANRPALYSTPAALVNQGTAAVEPAGGSQPHPNVKPSITTNCIIALQGIFPPQN